MSKPTLTYLCFFGAFVFLSVGCPSLISAHPDNLDEIPDVCPSQESLKNVTGLASPGGECAYDERAECVVDDQCKIGSKCCRVDDCSRRCIDLKDGSISDPKVRIASVKKQRRRRQSFGCASCVCIRHCRTDAECARESRRRRRCYHNTCSSYCTT